MRVYIAGPYTNPDPVQNARTAIMAAEKVYQAGHSPFIPHLVLLWDFHFPKDNESWFQYCLHWLELCDALIRLPGYSPGADREVARAESLGIPVYTLTEFLAII